MQWNASGAYIGGSIVLNEWRLQNVARTFIAPQRVTYSYGNTLSFDMNVATDFSCNAFPAGELGFSNVTQGQRGMIYLDNSSGVAITLAGGILAPTDMEADISTAGIYLLSYWAITTSTVVLSYSGPMV
jgi:hypothetical protein